MSLDPFCVKLTSSTTETFWNDVSHEHFVRFLVVLGFDPAAQGSHVVSVALIFHRYVDLNELRWQMEFLLVE